MDNETIGLQIRDLGLPKQYERRAPKLNGDFRGATRQALSGPQIERHAGPTPVVDLQPQGDIGLGVGCGRNLGFAAITQQLLPCATTVPVLPANCSAGYVLWIGNLNAVEDFRFFVAPR